jgi:hypothetical protein
MKHSSSLILLSIIFLLSACSPHPTSGVWKATGDNNYGIDKLVVAFDGKAYFTTTKPDNITWHCFWTASSKIESELKCTPSNNPDQEERYTLTLGDKEIAQLRHNNQQIASFSRPDKNASQL